MNKTISEESDLFLVRHNLGFGELIEPATAFELKGVAQNKLFDCALLWYVQDSESGIRKSTVLCFKGIYNYSVANLSDSTPLRPSGLSVFPVKVRALTKRISF